MKSIAAAALAITAFVAPALSSAQYPNGTRPTLLPDLHGKHEVQVLHSATTPARPNKEHEQPSGQHRHRVNTILIYVPTIGSFDVPYYYYAPSTPVYVDRDPPDYAYRDSNGFYYWCPDPAGYYPDQLVCSVSWRLVAP
jgi:hypothetical protein